MIYYVEDDTNIRQLTIYALEQAGFEAQAFSSAHDFFEACQTRTPDLILLDIMLPEINGLEILQMVRKDPQMKNLPIMMLTAKGTEFDKVSGLDAGADDYLAKPFGMMELISRVKALLRRSQTAAETNSSSTLTCGPIVLNTDFHSATAGGNAMSLTLKEFDLLRVLMENEGRVLARSQLFEEVWKEPYFGETRTIDVHIQTLRQKLSAACEEASSYVHTIRGVGYCLKRP